MDVVLVSPLKPENIGAVARVMMNFGYNQLILVTPRANPLSKEAVIVARKARSILEESLVVENLEHVRKSHSYLIGTTARIGGEKTLNRLVLPVTHFMTSSKEIIRTQWKNMALVLGPEDRGLSNEEAASCDVLLTISTSTEYPVLNLSHAAAILLYLLRTVEREEHSHKDEAPLTTTFKHRPATNQEKDLLIEKFAKIVRKSNFRKHKRQVVINAFKNILSRGYVSGRETLVLMGLFNWLDRRLNERPDTTEADNEK